MTDAPSIPVWRLNLLRLCYALLAFGLGTVIWPGLLDPDRSWDLMHGVTTAMLGALSALSLLGLRYPLAMLPLLFFEMGWKAIWLARVALPAWTSGDIDPGTANIAIECLPIVVFPLLIPWDHVARTYITRPGDPWASARR